MGATVAELRERGRFDSVDNIQSIVESFYKTYEEYGNALISARHSHYLDFTRLGEYTTKVLPREVSKAKDNHTVFAKCIIYTKVKGNEDGIIS